MLATEREKDTRDSPFFFVPPKTSLHFVFCPLLLSTHKKKEEDIWSGFHLFLAPSAS